MENIEDALMIAYPSAENLRVEECRRLTGPGLWANRPGAVLEVHFSGFEPSQIDRLWQAQARRVLDAIGWRDEQLTTRHFDGGVNLVLSAPMDQLYSAVFIAETAWHHCASALLGQPASDFAAMVRDLQPVMRREANPALIALLTDAGAHQIDALCDDDTLSLGYGTGSQSWPMDSLPTPETVDWHRLHQIPVVLITGTNGKTTTTRLCAAIARAAGKVAGLTSTDMVQIGGEVLERGDFSGPGGARTLLRDPRLEIGILEVARGGILRRGLPLRHAQVAVVTNVAADHLGQYGVNTVAELATAKFAVQRALVPGGLLVLNADDPQVVAEAANAPGPLCWFSLDPDAPQIRAARAAALPCAWLEGEVILAAGPTGTEAILKTAAIPITMGGAARYNIQNALAAICVARALGFPTEAIRAALAGFRSDPVDNPGRCNEFYAKGARLFVDFAHNPHSIAAVTSALAAIPAKRRFVLLSHAGDRSDQDIRDLTTGAFALHPDFIVAAELPDYLRGRQPGAVTGLIVAASKPLGLPADHVLQAPSPAAGVRMILDRLQPGDLALLLVHSERDEIFRMLAGSE